MIASVSASAALACGDRSLVAWWSTASNIASSAPASMAAADRRELQIRQACWRAPRSRTSSVVVDVEAVEPGDGGHEGLDHAPDVGDRDAAFAAPGGRAEDGVQRGAQPRRHVGDPHHLRHRELVVAGGGRELGPQRLVDGGHVGA